MRSCLFRDGEADLLGERLFDLDGVLEADRLGEVLALLARHEHGHILALLLGNLLALGFWHLQRGRGWEHVEQGCRVADLALTFLETLTGTCLQDSLGTSWHFLS